jgi:hypothetical protein
MSQGIESRKRPQLDVYRQPVTDEPPIFRLPLPPARRIVRSAIPVVAYPLLACVGALALAHLEAAAPTFLAAVLGGGALINLAAAGIRTLSPKAQVSELISVAGVLAVCGFVLYAHDKLWRGGALDVGVLCPIVAIVLASAVGPALVFGRTASDSLGWAGACLGLLLAAKLPYLVSPTAAYYALFLPVVGLNLSLAWLIGAAYARYRLTDPLLTHRQATEGEATRRTFYGYGAGEKWGPGFEAAVVFVVCALGLSLAEWQDCWEIPLAQRPEGWPLMRPAIVVIACVLIAVLPPVIAWRPRQTWSSVRLIVEAHLVWFGYNAEPAAGSGTFHFPRAIALASTRRKIYGLLLIVNVLTVRFFFVWADLRIDELGSRVWPHFALTILLPLFMPFGLSVHLHRAALLAIQGKIEKEADHD